MDKKLGKVILLAAEIREKSYDKKAADKYEKSLKPGSYMDFGQFYKLDLMQSVKKAIEQFKMDKALAFPVYLLLSYCWNDIKAWAEEITK